MKEIFTYKEVPAKGFRQKLSYALTNRQANFHILKEGKVVQVLTAWEREYVRHTVSILNNICAKCTRGSKE